ncbi:MAG: molybdopterin cofactor-binding domain-containing protein, partial [Lentilitoribacter sp.]
MNQSASDIKGGVHQNQTHDSAHKHVSGTAEYIDDINEPTGLLHAYLGLSEIANGAITSMDLSAVEAEDGVIGVLTADDINGHNDISPTGKKDDPVFAQNINFHGQPIFAVIAKTRAVARKAAKLAKVEYQTEDHITDVADAIEQDYPLVTEPLTLKRGDAEKALETSSQRISGQMRIGGQDHFYLEGHIAMAIPGEDDDVLVYSSTQHPSEVQHMVGHVLNIPSHAITVNVRRMGGGFGGKETQSNLFAAVAALAAKKYNQAVKIRPDRDDDMIATGKRHDFLVNYDVGFNDDGKIKALDATFAARCGNSADLSGPVTDRALF